VTYPVTLHEFIQGIAPLGLILVPAIGVLIWVIWDN
jgi:hypothetical protein